MRSTRASHSFIRSSFIFRFNSRSYASLATKSHYDTLKVPVTSTQKEIKNQFYALSRIHHPDVKTSTAKDAKIFVGISEAYSVLSDPKLRASYDQTLSSQAYTSPRSNSSGSGYAQEYGYKRHTTYRQRQTLNPDDYIQFRRRTTTSSQYPSQYYNHREHQRMHYTDWINENEKLFDEKVRKDARQRRTPFWKVLLVCIGFLCLPDLFM